MDGKKSTNSKGRVQLITPVLHQAIRPVSIGAQVR